MTLIELINTLSIGTKIQLYDANKCYLNNIDVRSVNDDIDYGTDSVMTRTVKCISACDSFSINVYLDEYKGNERLLESTGKEHNEDKIEWDIIQIVEQQNMMLLILEELTSKQLKKYELREINIQLKDIISSNETLLERIRKKGCEK